MEWYEKKVMSGMRVVLAVDVDKCKKYLGDTDWYAARKIDNGLDIPADIVSKRQLCRDKISEVTGNMNSN